MTTPAAELIGVSQRFGSFTAVDAIDLQIPRGRLTTLLGPSGCGKTTTLRMLAGYSAPTSGRILIEGDDATRTPPEKRNLGMVFQSYALFPHLTVADNVAYGPKMRRVPAPERRLRANEALELVGLAHLADRKPKQLSGGQQQRVALARAIAIRPRLLLLDEPLSNLDARLRVQMRAEIRRIQSETGLTIVLVTHDQDEALEMSDEMVLMRSGKIVQSGAPRDVFPAPADRFVAEFLGYENFLALGDGRQAAVRPEHLRVVPLDTPADGAVALDAVVRDVAYRGVDLLVTLDATDATGAAVRLLADHRADTATGPTPSAGDRVRILAPEARLALLDPTPIPATPTEGIS
ncbi:putative spermidine/putrescine transport system ATP-binding protein [Promicromonospora umidemergens]|uniref:ABC transporter domain-containing protein n=1 Tax=Promicromonospora umidemergens TaxID=629679 RepID=A0ABP8YCS5_9MICO|nr:ABC transporter ATP-binding protein [Promicromonospora umidemergens]MCP2286858.1 putative spermidine/putrescine transport system ATP-binding protein [Promicromonospora umidemergens]